MSIIKGKQNVVAGFGGTKRCIGEVYFSQSSLASDNPGALPGWTGEYYENGKTLFPDLYNFVKAHSELQVTKAEYDSAIATYGECPKYVVDENGGTTTGAITVYGWLASASTFYTKTRTPVAGDPVWSSTDTTQESLYEVISLSNDTLTFSGPTKEWTGTYTTTATGTGTVTTTGTSLRLPKYKNKGRYLVKSETNGSSWYNLYSDGWLEQGGYFANPQTIGTGAITETFLKSYATPPTVLFGNMSHRKQAAYDSEHYPYNVTANGFTHENVQPEGQGTRWYAFGYAADTPMENIMYPWVCAYNAAIPASVAQAAEFTGALSGKANTDLSNVPTGYDYVIEYQVNTDGSWYRKYKSGWLEQGGKSAAVAGGGSTIVTFPKAFANTTYTVLAQICGGYTPKAEANAPITAQTKTGFTIYSGSFATSTFNWRAEGQGA